jgi:hypothetical protein
MRGAALPGVARSTHSLCFFLGPGLPRTLGSPLPFAAAADLLTPFFFGPSAGGPMAAGCGAGVPAAGVLGVESDAFSAREFVAAGSVVEVAGESFVSFSGESSFAKPGSTMARSFWELVRRVTTREGLEGLPPVIVAVVVAPAVFDFRRSLDAAWCLLDGGMIKWSDDKIRRCGGRKDLVVTINEATARGIERRNFGLYRDAFALETDGALAQAAGSVEGDPLVLNP